MRSWRSRRAYVMVAILRCSARRYYQGRSNMVPTAVSQVIEAAGKLFIGLGLACWAVGRGFDDPVVAALTVLRCHHRRGRRGGVHARAGGALAAARHGCALDPAVRPTLTLAKTLLSLSIPITISSSVMSITDLIDVALISSRLQSRRCIWRRTRRCRPTASRRHQLLQSAAERSSPRSRSASCRPSRAPARQ